MDSNGSEFLNILFKKGFTSLPNIILESYAELGISDQEMMLLILLMTIQKKGRVSNFPRAEDALKLMACLHSDGISSLHSLVKKKLLKLEEKISDRRAESREIFVDLNPFYLTIFNKYVGQLPASRVIHTTQPKPVTAPLMPAVPPPEEILETEKILKKIAQEAKELPTVNPKEIDEALEIEKIKDKLLPEELLTFIKQLETLRDPEKEKAKTEDNDSGKKAAKPILDLKIAVYKIRDKVLEAGYEDEMSISVTKWLLKRYDVNVCLNAATELMRICLNRGKLLDNPYDFLKKTAEGFFIS